MTPKIKLTIITPDGKLLEEEIDQLTTKTTTGEITILPNHIPLLTPLVTGELLIIKDKRESLFGVYGGFLEVRPNNQVVILADAAEHPEKIDLKAAEEAKERAQKIMKEKFDTTDYEDAALALERELARIRIVKKYRSKWKNIPYTE